MDTTLTTVVDHIRSRVNAVNVNNLGNQNSGAVAMRFYKNLDDELEQLIYSASSILQSHFIKESSDSFAGSAKLTGVSSSIGRALYRKMGQTDPSISDQIRLGDLIVEGFYLAGFIDLKRCQDFNPLSNQAPHIVYATDKWAEICEIKPTILKSDLVATVFEKPDDLSSLFNPVSNRPYVKGWNKKQLPLFNTMLETPWADAVNLIHQTGWKINKQVLEAVIANEDKFVVEPRPMPKGGFKHEYEAAESAYKAFTKKNPLDNTSDEFLEVAADYKAKSNAWNERRAVLKQRSKVQEYKRITSKATLLSEAPVFYQTIEADYRGRIYYAEPFLNFQGNDTAKGLLLFSEGKVLDDVGFTNLMLYAASNWNKSFTLTELDELYENDVFSFDYASHLRREALENISLDKMSLTDRVQYMFHKADFITETAEQKLIHSEDDVEKPVLFLASCLEIYNASKAHDAGDDFISHLPVAVDGTTNGVCHSAAISKDDKTAQFVGLIPTEIPSDFYVVIAKEMMVIRPEWYADRPDMKMKDVRKNISKRAAMIRQYAAGAQSITDNMFADCYQSGAAGKFNIQMTDCMTLAKDAIKAIDTICPSMRKTMSHLQSIVNFELGYYEWVDSEGEVVSESDRRRMKREQKALRNDANTDEEFTRLSELSNELASHEKKLVAGNGKARLEWITPSGFHVIQERWRENSAKVRGTIQGYTRVTHNIKVNTDIPDRNAMVTGISPNFIHSMDSSHMCLAFIELDKIASGTASFGAVHDSFACHANDVNLMVDAAKASFIEMYDVDNFYEVMENMILSDSSKFFVERPILGDLDIDIVNDSEFFFS